MPWHVRLLDMVFAYVVRSGHATACPYNYGMLKHVRGRIHRMRPLLYWIACFP